MPSGFKRIFGIALDKDDSFKDSGKFAIEITSPFWRSYHSTLLRILMTFGFFILTYWSPHSFYFDEDFVLTSFDIPNFCLDRFLEAFDPPGCPNFA